MSHQPQPPSQPAAIIGALVEVWDSTAALIGQLGNDDFSKPTPCSDWSVQDIAAHIVATEIMMLDAAADDDTHFERIRDVGRSSLLAEFRDVTRRRVQMLEGMTAHEWSTASFAPLEGMPYEHVMVVRTLDCWVHEQDIRDATGHEGNEWGLAAAATVDATCFLAGAVPATDANTGAGTVVFSLTVDGEVVREVVLTSSSHPSSTAGVAMPVGHWVRLCGGRVGADELGDRVTINGDRAAAEGALAQLQGSW